MIKKLLIRMFLGKETTEEVEVGVAKAIITDDDGQLFTITRKGYADYNSYCQQIWKTPGMDLLRAYMSESKKQVLVDDAGKMVAVCRIKKIDIEESTHKDSVTYYK